jgi:hypothetical protein
MKYHKTNYSNKYENHQRTYKKWFNSMVFLNYILIISLIGNFPRCVDIFAVWQERNNDRRFYTFCLFSWVNVRVRIEKGKFIMHGTSTF